MKGPQTPEGHAVFQLSEPTLYMSRKIILAVEGTPGIGESGLEEDHPFRLGFIIPRLVSNHLPFFRKRSFAPIHQPLIFRPQ